MSNSPVIAFLNKMTDLLLLNLLYLVCCLPIVTIGAATTALYYVSIVSIRSGDGYVIRRFLDSFRKNFKQATIIWLVLLCIGVVLGIDLFFWYRMGSGFSKVMFCISMVPTVVVAIIALWIFPVLSKLKGGIKTTIKNAAAFGVGYFFPYTLILIVLTGVFIWANLNSLGMNAITLMIGFALFAYIKSFFIYKVMMNHIDERFDDYYEPLND